MSEKVSLEVAIETAKSAKNLGQLEEAAADLNDRLKKSDFGTQEFKDLSTALVGVNKEIKNTELSIEALDNEQVASELGSVAGAVGDMTSAFVLLGGTGGALEETAVKIETALGVSMAFKGAIEGISSGRKLFNNILKQSNVLQRVNNQLTKVASPLADALGISTDLASKSFKNLKIVIAATGIGLLVVGIGALISNWDKITAALSRTTKAQKIYNEASKEALENVAEELSAADKLSRILKDEAVSRNDKVKAVKALQKEYPGLLSNVDAEKDGITEINKALELNSELLVLKAKQQALVGIRTEAYRKQLETELEIEQTLQDKKLSAFGAELLGYESVEEMKDAAIKKNTEASNKELTAIDKIDKALKEEIKTIKERGAAYLNATEISELVVDKTIEDGEKVKKEIGLVLDRIEPLGVKMIETQTQMKDVAVQTATEAKIAWAEFYNTLDELREKEKQKNLDNMAARLDLAAVGIDALIQLNSAFVGETEAQQKMAFERNKKLQIAQALISSASGVVNILSNASTIPDPFGLPYKIVNIAALALTTLAQIALIKKTKFEGGNTAGVSGFTPPAGGGFTPELSPVTNTSTVLPTGEEDNKVYVTETDISNVQYKVNVIEAQATIK